jgi:hypothetical protein
MAEIKNINAIVQHFHNHVNTDWADPNIPVPDGMWVYDTVSRCIYKGDGVNLIGNLDPFWDIASIEDISNYYDTVFPKDEILNDSTNNNQLLVVSPSGSNYVVGVLDISQLVSMEDLTNILVGLSNITHNHNEEFYTKEETDNILTSNASPFSNEEIDLLSKLLLEELDEDTINYQQMPYGFCDTTIDNKSVDIDNSTGVTIDTDNNRVSISEGELISSNIYSLEVDNITSSRTLLRVDLSDIEDVENNVFIEVSRDGGVNYAYLDKELNSLICANYKYLAGETTFDKKLNRNVVNVKNIVLDDRKGNVNNIEVIESNKMCRFDASNTNIGIGNVIVLTNGKGIIITKILSNDTVEFIGELVKGTYGIRHIYPLKYEADNRIVNYVQDIDRGWEIKNTPLDIIGLKGHVSTILQDKIYIYGGKDNGNENNFHQYIYDIATKTWSKSVTEHNTNYAQRVTVGDKFYTIAGKRDGSIVSHVYMFDGENYVDVTKAEMQNRMGHVSEAINNKIITLGGENDDSGSYVDVDGIEIYDTELDKLDTKALTIPKRSYGASTKVDNSMFIQGGHSRDLNKNLDDFWEMEYKDWEILEDGPKGRYNHVGVKYNNYFVIGLGSDGEKYLNDFWFFDFNTIKWDKYDGPLNSREQAAFIFDESNGFLYIHGGYGDNGTLNDLWKFNLVDKTWVRLTDGPQLKGHRGFIYNNELYFICGEENGIFLDTIYKYNITNDVWELYDRIGLYRTEISIGIINDKVYIYGGRDDSGYLSEIWEYDIITKTKVQKTSDVVGKANSSYLVKDNKLVIYGGITDIGAENELKEYDPISDSWSLLEYGIANEGSVLINNNEVFYWFGGIDKKYSYIDSGIGYIDITNADMDYISYKVDNRQNFGITKNNDDIYIHGGQSLFSSNYIWELDTDNWKWNKIRTLPAEGMACKYMKEINETETLLLNYKFNSSDQSIDIFIYKHNKNTDKFMSVKEDKIYDISWINNALVWTHFHDTDTIFIHSGTNTCGIYKISTGQFTRCTNAPISLFVAYAKYSYNDKIYINTHPNNYLLIYDTITDQWTQIDRLSSVYHKACSVKCNDYIYFLTGTECVRINVNNNTVQVRANLNIPLINCVAFSKGDFIYLAGGLNTNDGSSRREIYRYDTINDQWSITDIKLPIISNFRADFHEYINEPGTLQLFSPSGSKILSDLWKYNSASKWTCLINDIGSPRRSHSISYHDNVIYIIGGYKEWYCQNIVSFDLNTQTSSIVVTYSSYYLYLPYSCTVNNYIYIVNGHAAQPLQLLRLNPVTGALDVVANLPFADIHTRYYGTIVRNIGNKLYFYYAQPFQSTDLTTLYNLYEYDLDNPELGFVEKAYPPKELKGTNIFADDQYLYMGYGIDSSDSYNKKLYRFSPNENIWEVISEANEKIVSAKYEIINNKVYVFGGRKINDDNEASMNKDTIIYNLEPLTTKQLPSPNLEVSNHQLFNIGDNIYLYGGVLSDGSPNTTPMKYNRKTETWEAIVDDNLINTLGQLVDTNILTHGNLAYGFGGDTGQYYLNDKLSIFTPQFDFEQTKSIVQVDYTGLGNILPAITGTDINNIPCLLSEDNGLTYNLVTDTGTRELVVKYENNNWLYNDGSGTFIQPIKNTLQEAVIKAIEVNHNTSHINTDQINNITLNCNTNLAKVIFVFTGNEDQLIDLPEDAPYYTENEVLPAGSTYKLRITNNEPNSTIQLHGISAKWKE